MKHGERQHLKDNELAIALGHANEFRTRHGRTLILAVGGVLVVAAAVLGLMAWRGNVDVRARALLAEAMVVQEGRVVPPTVDLSGNASPSAPVQQPGTYPSERAKLEAALPKFMAAAEEYPSTDAAQTARYNAAGILVGLGRYDEAVAQYDGATTGRSGLLAEMARLGKAEAQLRATQYDAAIASFKQISESSIAGVPKGAMLLELARAYTLAGKSDDARKTLTQVVEQHADTPFASEAKTELEKLKS